MSRTDPPAGELGPRRARLAERQRQHRFERVALGTALVVLSVGVAFSSLRADPAPEPAPAPAPAPPVTTVVECPPLLVVAAPEISDVLSTLAAEYEPPSEACAQVRVEPVAPADVAGALSGGWDEAASGRRPDVWIPDSSSWIRYVEANLPAAELLAGPDVPVAHSPTVLAMPRPLAEALGWPDTHPGYGQILPLVTDPATWTDLGHPEWGPFRFAMPEPARSTAGLHALLSIAAAQSGTLPDALSPAGLSRPEVRGRLLSLERGTATARPGSVEELLGTLRQADAAGEPSTVMSAAPLAERDVWRYNRDADVPLVALHPPEGGLAFDYPYQVLVGELEDRADAFRDFLLSPAAQERLTAEGFRDAGNDFGETLAADAGIQPELVGPTVPPPDGAAIQAALRIWQALSQRGSTLAVIDTSGSMAELVPGTETTLLQVTVESALRGLTLFADDSKVGLWEFSTELPGGAQGGDYRELVPLGDVGGQVDGVPRRERLAAALRGLQPTNDTALYDTLLAAYTTVQSAYEPGRPNTVVLFTDSFTDGDDLTLDGLLEQLSAQADPARPVQVVFIAYGQQPDLPALERITDLVGGQVFTPQSPDEISQAFLAVLTGG